MAGPQGPLWASSGRIVYRAGRLLPPAAYSISVETVTRSGKRGKRTQQCSHPGPAHHICTSAHLATRPSQIHLMGRAGDLEEGGRAPSTKQASEQKATSQQRMDILSGVITIQLKMCRHKNIDLSGANVVSYFPFLSRPCYSARSTLVSWVRPLGSEIWIQE